MSMQEGGESMFATSAKQEILSDPREKKMRQFIQDKDYQTVMDIMTEVVNAEPDLFFNGDSEFEIQYNKYVESFETDHTFSEDKYFKFIDNVVTPFWEKVRNAGKAIPDDAFTKLEGL